MRSKQIDKNLRRCVKGLLRCGVRVELYLLVAFCVYPAVECRADLIFNLGGAAPVSYVQGTGIREFPIFIGTTGADIFTAVEFFVDTGTVYQTRSLNSTIGTLSESGMVGASTNIGRVAVAADGGPFGTIARFDGTYNPAVLPPAHTNPLDNARLFATFLIDTNTLALGTYNFSVIPGSERILNGGTPVPFTFVGGSFEITAIPEPGSAVLLLIAASTAGTASYLRRRTVRRRGLLAQATPFGEA